MGFAYVMEEVWGGMITSGVREPSVIAYQYRDDSLTPGEFLCSMQRSSGIAQMVRKHDDLLPIPVIEHGVKRLIGFVILSICF